MPTTDVIKETSSRIGRSATFKLFTICLLILALLIPSSMVKSMIREREARKQSVVNEVSAKWGRAQTVTGPVITVPYAAYVEGRKGKTTKVIRYLHLLPDTVNIKSRITPHVRSRGIYEAVLYNTMIDIDGSFSHLPIDELRIPSENIIWPGAFVSFGITDMRGIKEQIRGTFGGTSLSMEPGVETHDVFQSGVSAPVRLDGSRKLYPFKFAMNLNGSRQMHFAPVGKVTSVSASSDWKDPSFDGAFLPVERSISPEGFSANWRVLHLNRDYPQYWKGGGQNLSASTFGLKLFKPVDVYQKSMRTAKYALMFIVFTFLAFFISEVMNRMRVHPVQYLLIGLAVIVFYTLLLSFSEQIRFGAAYLLSSGATICLIGGYAKAILKNRYAALMVGGVLVILYAYLYILLQLEDYALLMGSVGLFTVLGVIMYLTRKIDWYGMQPEALKARTAKAPGQPVP